MRFSHRTVNFFLNLLNIVLFQLEQFRSLMDANEEPLIRNFRNIQPLHNRRVFHVCPSKSKYSTLLPIPQAIRRLSIGASSKSPRPLKSESQHSYQEIYRTEIYCQNPFRNRHVLKDYMGHNNTLHYAVQRSSSGSRFDDDIDETEFSDYLQ